jgi:peptide deformylase
MKMETKKFKLLPSTSPLLRQACRAVTADDDIAELVSALQEICIEKNGAGLAANQIGVNLRIFVLNIDGMRVYINPEILHSESLAPFFGEGCLSFPNEIICTRRYEKITIWADNCETRELEGLEAIAFQHELDHLDGITMHNRSI